MHRHPQRGLKPVGLLKDVGPADTWGGSKDTRRKPTKD